VQRKLIATALVAMFAATASAGATLEIETKSKQQPTPTYPGMPTPAAQAKQVVTTSTVKAEGKKLNMTAPSADDPAGKNSTMVFDGKVMSVQDHRKREYHLMTKEKVKAMLEEQERMRAGAGGMGGVPGGGMPGAGGGDIDASIKRLEETLANLPPQTPANVRAMIETQLKNLEAMKKPAGEDGKPKPFSYTNEGTVTFEGKSYSKWTVKNGDVLKKHVYTLPLDESGAAKDAYEAFKAYGTYMQEIRDLMPKNLPFQQQQSSITDEMKHITGFPWITIEYDDGKITSETRVKNAKAESHEDTVFLARPEGYTEVDPFKRGARPGRGGGGLGR